MRVLVQGISPQGHAHLASPSMHARLRADGKPEVDANGAPIWDAGQGRFFPTGKAHEIEVLMEQDEDPPEVTREIPNGTTGMMDKVKRPDPDRMGRKSYEALLADKRFRIVQTDTVDAAIADAAVQAARAEVSRLAGENADLRVDAARKDEEIARLTALLEAKTKPADAPPPAPAAPAPDGAATKAEAKTKPGKETPPAA